MKQCQLIGDYIIVNRYSMFEIWNIGGNGNNRDYVDDDDDNDDDDNEGQMQEEID